MNIIYRCSEDEVTRNYRPQGTLPNWLDKKKCFKSLINSTKNQVPVYVIHDGPSGELEQYIKQFNVSFEKINLRSNVGSQIHCLHLAKKLGTDVYFLEDDYLHLPHAISYLEEGIKKFGLVSTYDHPDRYTRIDDITYKKEEIGLTKSCHWRTAEATTCTWAASKEILDKILDDAISYGIEDRAFFRHIYITKGIRLWQTIPGCSTHVVSQYQTPLLNWECFNSSIKL